MLKKTVSKEGKYVQRVKIFENREFLSSHYERAEKLLFLMDPSV